MMKEILLSKTLGQQKSDDYGKFYDEGIKKGMPVFEAMFYAHESLAKKYKYKNPIRIKKKQS